MPSGYQLVVRGNHSAPLLVDESWKYDIVERDGCTQVDAPSGENLSPASAEFGEDQVRRPGRQHLILAGNILDESPGDQDAQLQLQAPFFILL